MSAHSPGPSGPWIRGTREIQKFLKSRGIPIGIAAVREALVSGELAHYQVGGVRVCSPDDIDRWLASLRVEAAQ